MPIQPGIELTKEAILSRTTQEKILEYYLGYEIDITANFINPLRPDRRPGCRFYYNDKGRLYFHDFGKFHWDCFAVVQYRYNLTFIEALRKIVHDFNLKEVEEQFFATYNAPIKEREEIRVAVREWNKQDLAFWKAGNIDIDTLNWGKVFPLKAFWINNNYYKCWKVDPTYCYYFGNGLYKLYFPARKESRFFQNINQLDDDLTQGWNLLPEVGDILFITKSYKDVLSMKTFGLISDSVLSETHLIRSEKIERYRSRFKQIFTLFDNDQTGRRLAIKYYKTYNIPYLMFPKGWKKDFFANVALLGNIEMTKIIHLWKQKLK